jgi:hypothetical protein
MNSSERFQKDLKSFNYKNSTREETLNPVSQLDTLASAKNNINETKKTIITPQTTLHHEKINKTITTNNNFKDNNYRNLFLNEQKKNMDSKQQISYLQKKIEYYTKLNNQKEKILNQLKNNSIKDNEYLANLEKFYLNIIKKSKPKSNSTGKLMKMNKYLDTYNTSCLPTKNNTKEEIFVSNTDNIEQIKDEYVKLYDLINKILERSKENDLINFDVFSCLQKIEELLIYLQSDLNNGNNINSQLNEVNENFNKIINSIDIGLTSKQKQFNIILENKDEEMKLLSKEIINVQNENIDLDYLLEQTEKEIKALEIENKLLKLKTQLNYDYNKKEGQNGQNEKEIQKKNLDKKLKKMKNSLNNSVNKIKKNFDMDKEENIYFVNSIQNQID